MKQLRTTGTEGKSLYVRSQAELFKGIKLAPAKGKDES